MTATRIWGITFLLVMITLSAAFSYYEGMYSARREICRIAGYESYERTINSCYRYDENGDAITVSLRSIIVTTESNDDGNESNM